MGMHAKNTIETGVGTSKEDCQEIAKAMVECEDICITKLRVSYRNTERGYAVEYICKPTLDDFLDIIEKDGWFICECDSDWFPPNGFLKVMIEKHPTAILINDWYVPTEDTCGSDEWNIETYEDFDEEDVD
jgi:hypothetical protein